MEHAFAFINHHAKRTPRSPTQSKALTIIYHDAISVFLYELPDITITISCTTLHHLLHV
jgi:hypothetical protein